MPASPSTISSCCLRWLPGVARPNPRPGTATAPAPGSWRGAAVARDRALNQAGQANSGPADRPSSGRSTHRRPTTRPRPRAGT